jgi:hypothetical protein
MAKAYTVYQNVDTLAISRIVAEGDVRNYSQKVARRVVARAIRMAPKRSGELAASHHYRTYLLGPRDIVALVYNDAPYALAVHEGTGPEHQYFSRTSGNGKPYFKFYSRGVMWRLNRVHGQRAQPWLADALALEMLEH